MKKDFKIFTLNFGSTSTKFTLFHNKEKVYDDKVNHDAKILATFPEIVDQLDYRKETILNQLAENDISLEGVDAIVGRCGCTGPIPGGIYEINDLMVEILRTGKYSKHTALLGGLAANDLAKIYGAKALIVNPPDTDEFQDLARITGWKGLYRVSATHTLNQKEIALRYAENIGKKYTDLNLILAHIGGGVSVTPHRKGKMVDSNSLIHGEGPMAPTRSGALPVLPVIEMCFSGKYTKKEMMDRVNMCGGLMDHLGTSDILEVKERIKNGDEYAKLIYDVMIYQIGKQIGSSASVLHGEVDAIILTGGISRDQYLVDKITEMNSYIAPIVAMPGEFEMEALGMAGYRVLSGQEVAQEYKENLCKRL